MRWWSVGSVFGLCLLLSAGCSSGGTPDAGPDGGEPDAADPDGGDAVPDGSDDGGSVADEGADGSDDDLWGWCPDASMYVGGDWNNSAVAEEDILFCVVNQGSIEEAIGNKAQLRFVPGTYPLPDEAGSFPVLIPACILAAGNVESQHMDTGLLTVTTREVSGSTLMQIELSQPMRVGDRQWDIVLRANLYYPAGESPPQLVIGDELAMRENGREVSLWYDLRVEGLEWPWSAYPCEPAEFNTRETRVEFDRGSLAVEAEVYSEMEYGGQGPAILRQGLGELDGEAFEQRDYWRLAHLPAHHNWGGTFLVLFDEPVGIACGIKLEVPSSDGGGPPLGAWTLACDLSVIDELPGLVVEYP